MTDNSLSLFPQFLRLVTELNGNPQVLAVHLLALAVATDNNTMRLAAGFLQNKDRTDVQEWVDKLHSTFVREARP